MNNKYLQEKLGELIYELAEINFSCIEGDFFDKHVNQSEPFTSKQIEVFSEFLSEIIKDHQQNSMRNTTIGHCIKSAMENCPLSEVQEKAMINGLQEFLEIMEAKD